MANLDSLCGATFTYRELFECSNSWKRAAGEGATVYNVPAEPASFTSLLTLCVELVDPLAVAFGRPILTYGFGSKALTRKIHGQIAPELDQHACHERNANGELICSRLGAAVDLAFPSIPATVIARWIHSHRPFDRLYLYGDERPLHVSLGPDLARSVVEMVTGSSGRRVPRVLRW